MQLSDLFEQLAQGELRSMSLGGSEYSGILEINYPKIIPHINLGLIELCKRYPIKTKAVTIQLHDHITNYVLNSRYAKTNTSSTAAVKYLIDSVYDPFITDEFLSVDSVYSENGKELTVNDENDVYSVFTPSYNIIQVPFNDLENAISVVYRAAPTKLYSSGEGVLEQEINISPAYLNALLLFVAGRYYSTMGGELATAEGNNFLARFEMACQDLDRLSLFKKENPTNLKLENRGWM